MNKLLLPLAVAALTASASFAETYNYTFESAVLKTNDFTGEQTLSLVDATTNVAVDWTFSIDPINANSYYFGKDNTKGMQIGSAKAPAKIIEISTNYFNDKKVSKITFNLSLGGSANFSGEILADQSSEAITITKDATDYTLELENPVEVEYLAVSVENSNTATSGNGAFYIKSISIEYTDDNDNRADADLSFPLDSYEGFLGTHFDAPIAASIAGITDIVYSSSNPSVATVNETTGEVALIKVGETIITATFAGNDSYKPASAEYSLTVVDNRETLDLHFAEEEYSVNLGDEFIAPELEGTVDGLTGIFYTSSNENVATVDITTGDVTILSRGVTIIKAIFSGNEEYKPTEALYHLTVVDQSALIVDFDFKNEDYGLTRFDSSDGNQYNENPTIITSAPVTLTLDGGNNRLWNNDGLRMYKNSYVEISIASSYKIDSVSFTSGKDANFKCEKDNTTGNWKIAYNQSSGNTSLNTISVTYSQIATGIENVDLNNTKAVYYDLSGRRVNGDLGKGVYIKVCGNEVTKVIR